MARRKGRGNDGERENPADGSFDELDLTAKQDSPIEEAPASALLEIEPETPFEIEPEPAFEPEPEPAFEPEPETQFEPAGQPEFLIEVENEPEPAAEIAAKPDMPAPPREPGKAENALLVAGVWAKKGLHALKMTLHVMGVLGKKGLYILGIVLHVMGILLGKLCRVLGIILRFVGVLLGKLFHVLGIILHCVGVLLGKLFHILGVGLHILGILLKNLLIKLATPIYRYLYFVGIQLLRTTRVRRRHFMSQLRALRRALANRRKNRRHAVRRKLHELWRAFTSPVRVLRAKYSEFRTALVNARRFGGTRRLLGVYLHTAGELLGGLWRVIKFLLNYVAPITAIILLFSTITYFNGLTLALKVEYNGKDLGYIEDESIFNQAENDMKARIINETYIKPDDIIPKFELSVVDSQELVRADDLTDELIRASGNELEEAEGLYIQDKFVSAVSNGDGLLRYMDSLLEKYRTSDLDENAQIQFVKKIVVKPGLYPKTSVVPLDEVKEQIGGEERGEKRYTVIAGDDPLTIAAKNDITFKELKQMNPEVDVSLFPGDEVLISNSVPFLGVQVKTTIRYEEEMDFKVEQQTDSSRSIGYTYTKQEGEEGTREITAQIVMIDGVETERKELDSKILEQPVNRIVVVGGNKPLKVIPTTSSGKVTSGAFAWPTTQGRITTPWMGYSGHTGSDITFPGGNCYGAPVYASADGVVIASGWDPGWSYGNRVMIEHGGGFRTLYAHCSKVIVPVGKEVTQGQLIGYIGRTGNVTGPHLHFEVRVNGVPTNAAPYLYS